MTKEEVEDVSGEGEQDCWFGSFQGSKLRPIQSPMRLKL